MLQGFFNCPRGRGTVPAYGVRPRRRWASEGSKTGAVPYSVGGTVPADGVSPPPLNPAILRRLEASKDGASPWPETVPFHP